MNLSIQPVNLHSRLENPAEPEKTEVNFKRGVSNIISVSRDGFSNSSFIGKTREHFAKKRLCKLLDYLTCNVEKYSKKEEADLSKLAIENGEDAKINTFVFDVLNSRAKHSANQNVLGKKSVKSNREVKDWSAYIDDTLSLILAKKYMPKSVEGKSTLDNLNNTISLQVKNCMEIIENLKIMRNGKTKQADYNKCLSDIYGTLDNNPKSKSFRDFFKV